MEKLRSHSATMAAVVMGYQSVAQASKPYGKHSLLAAHQRSSSPLTQSMMGFRKSHFPHTGNPHASSRQTVGVMNVVFWRFLYNKKVRRSFIFPILTPHGSLNASNHVCIMWQNNFWHLFELALNVRRLGFCHVGLQEPQSKTTIWKFILVSRCGLLSDLTLIWSACRWPQADTAHTS